MTAAFYLVATLLTLATLVVIGRSLWRQPGAARASRDELNAAIYRDQMAELDLALAQGTLNVASHAESRESLRRRLAAELGGSPAESRSSGVPPLATAVASGLFVVAGAAGLYAWLGTPAALSPQVAVAQRNEGHSLTGEQMAGMVERLAAKLRENPDNLDGWVMLARSYVAMRRFDASAQAYAEAARLAPNHAGILADYADALAMAQGRTFEGEPDRIIARALQANPNHVKTLALAGSSAFARKDYEAAIGHWTRLREELPPEGDMARTVEASLAQAKGLAGGKGVAPTPVAARATAASAAPGPGLSGMVKLDPGLAARVQPGDTLFIYARAAEGSRMPLAIVRRPVAGWPVPFTLDDSNAMSAASRLSQQKEVVLEARISRSGSATAVRGDLLGSAGKVSPGRKDLVVEIGSAVE